MNGPLKVGNLTPEGLRWRRRSLRFLVAWIVTALGTVVGGGILLVACGVDLERREEAFDPGTVSKVERIYLESHGHILR